MATAIGIVVAMVGAGHLCAWLNGYMTLQGISSITLKTNAALALLLLGVALILLVPPNSTFSRRWAGRSLAIVPALIGLLSLCENLLGWDLKIDQLLANEPAGALGVVAPNLMGMPAAISFVLAGLALLIFSRRDDRGATAAQGLALAVCFIALLGTIGYLYGVQGLYAVTRLTGIAWPTALTLLTLGLGLLLARPTEGLMAQVTADDPGGANLRRWMPVMLLPIVLGWLRLTGERQGVFDAATGTAIVMIIFIVSLAVLAYSSSRPVSRSLADLRESEERYRSLFRNMAEAFALHEIITDAGGRPIDYRFLEVNDSFERITGLKRCDVVGRTVREVLPKIEDSWIETFGRVALTGEAVDFEKYYPAPLDRWYQVFAYRPAPLQFAAVFLDVSQRWRSEEELRASETRLRRFYESGLLGVIYWNMNGQITDANAKFLEMVGYDREDLKAGRIDWAKMTPPEYRHLDEQSAVELKSTGVNNHPFEKAYIRKDGMQLPVIVAGAMLDEERTNGVAFVLDITERKRAEEALRKAKEQLELRVQERTADLTEALKALRQTGNYTRSLIEASVDPLVTIGRDGRISDVNAATETATGRVRQELIGTDFSMYFTEPEKARTGYQQVFKDGSVRDYPLEIRHRDGHTIPVLYNAALYRDEAGEVAGIFAAARDITERKRTEEALRQSEQEFRTLAEAVPQIVWATRPDGWNVYFNQKWVDYTGLTLEESYGHGWNTPFHPDDQKRAWEAWNHATQDGAVYSLECRLRRADGIYRWWLIRGEPVRDANGNILKWFGSCTDIEDIKCAEAALKEANELLEQRVAERTAALRESRNQFRILTQNVGAGVALIDDQGKFAIVNPAFLRLFDLPSGSDIKNVNDRDWAQWQVFEENGELLDVDAHPIRKAVMTGKAVRDRLVAVRSPLGSLKWMLISAEPVLKADDRVDALICTYLDVTERKRAEETLRETVRELERSNRELEQFAYVSSHDLQEPLRQVMGFGNLLNERYADQLDDRAKQYIAFMAEGSTRMSNLVQALLDYSRVGRQGHKVETVSAQEALSGALLNLQGTVEKCEARLTWEKLPAVLANPVELGQLFQNLIGNALKFRREGVTPEVQVGCRGDGQTCMFWVKDNGIGIPPELHDKAFQVFQRLHGQGKYPGTGIGLAICKKIVEHHGGRIWIESTVGEGSTFFFTLPLAKEAQA